jgi:pimeloyl-ACP methyl ester carboxylesterase
LKINSAFFVAIFSLLLCGCYGKFTMSQKELKAYYKTHQPEPDFFKYDTLGHAVFYAHTGKKELPLLLFIHGAPGRWYGYINYLSDSSLLENFQMISIDRAGYGNSAKGGAVTSIEAQATLLQPIIDKYSKVPIIIVGRSYGGPIASYLAALNKVKVKALLLISNAADPKLEKFWWFSKPVQSKVGKLLFRKPIDVSSDEKFAHQKELEKMTPLWQEIIQPTIILQGGKDYIIYPENGKYTDSVLVNAPHQYIFLPNTGHLISNEQPTLVKNCLFDLINQVCVSPNKYEID